MCPSLQTDAFDATVCQPDFTGSINATSQSWTGIVCTPNDTVLCLSLPSWNLAGNVSALQTLAPLQDLQVVNLANNSLQGATATNLQAIDGVTLCLENASNCINAAGTLPPSLPEDFLNATNTSAISLGFLYLPNNSISGTLPALWGDSIHGWQQWLQGLYLEQNQLTGQLPHSWSDSNSLPNLGRMDVFLNQLSGPLSWNAANMPGLGNLVLLPGKLQLLPRLITLFHAEQQLLCCNVSLASLCCLSQFQPC